jgi:hypothetical protein
LNGLLDIHPKVAGGTLACALAVLIVWILSLVGIPVPLVADGALVTALSALGGWLAPAGYFHTIGVMSSTSSVATSEPAA